MRHSFVQLAAWTIFVCMTGTSFAEQSSAVKTLKVRGASMVVPKACEIHTRNADTAGCTIFDGENGYWSFGVFSATVPSFSSLMAETHPEIADPSEDIPLVLKGLVEASSETMVGDGARVEKFEHRPVRQVTKGAEGCEIVRKEGSFRNKQKQRVSVKTVELLCATHAGRGEILEVAIVVSYSFVPSWGEKAPADFQEQAAGWLGRARLSP